MVKEFLSRKGIPYKERNVFLDEEARKDLIAMGHRGTPVTVIKDHKIVGFSPAKLEAALKAAGL